MNPRQRDRRVLAAAAGFIAVLVIAALVAIVAQ